MNEITILTTLATIHFIALMSPGPDFALIVQTTTSRGRQAGLLIAAGLSAGILTHSFLGVTGVSLIVQSNPMLYSIVQAMGGSYLLYLGLSALHALLKLRRSDPAADEHIQPSTAKKRSQAGYFRKGFMTNILNPKALVFFISLLSSLVPAQMSVNGKIGAIVILWLLALMWFSFLAFALSTPKVANRIARAAPFIDGVCALLFTFVGGSILLQLLF